MAEYYSDYKMCFEGAGTNPGEKTLEDKFFEYEVGCLCWVPYITNSKCLIPITYRATIQVVSNPPVSTKTKVVFSISSSYQTELLF